MGNQHEFIKVDAVSMSYSVKGRHMLNVLDNISFSVAEKEFVCMRGESGCGKTTLLNIMGGHIKPTRGNVIIEGKPLDKPSQKYVSIFQDYKLLPWRTVRKNIELGLEVAKPPLHRKEIDRLVDAQIKSVGLTGFGDFRPAALSGGMKQRVAIARALVLNPTILLMDEPFGALDALIRDELRNKFRTLLKSTGQTVVMVTHNLNEAIYFADRIIIMQALPGRIASIVDVNLPDKRDVYTEDFHKIRDRVFACLSLPTS
jgi:NitT/TauT family transport system ATP-binding protein